jgi:hypothetical protein
LWRRWKPKERSKGEKKKKMLSNNKSDPAKKGYTLSEDVTDGLAKPVHTVVEERPERILIRRLEI